MTNLSNFVSTCSGYNGPRSPLGGILTAFKEVLIMVIGITHDCLLVIKLRKRNKSPNGPNQSKLVTWNKSKVDNIGFVVPISASIVALSSVLFNILIYFLFLTHGIEKDIFIVIFCIFPSILMPILFTLTSKVRRNHRTFPEVPSQLMFHDDISGTRYSCTVVDEENLQESQHVELDIVDEDSLDQENQPDDQHSERDQPECSSVIINDNDTNPSTPDLIQEVHHHESNEHFEELPVYPDLLPIGSTKLIFVKPYVDNPQSPTISLQ